MLGSHQNRIEFSHYLNRGVEGIPCIEWSSETQSHFPAKNNHNTVYYKAPKVFPEHLIEWLNTQVAKLEKDMQVLPPHFAVTHTKTHRCTRCNRDFGPKRDACVIRCACLAKRQEVKAQYCTRCCLLQWLLEGSQCTRVSPVYLSSFAPHPGYMRCDGCGDGVTLRDFFRIKTQ